MTETPITPEVFQHLRQFAHATFTETPDTLLKLMEAPLKKGVTTQFVLPVIGGDAKKRIRGAISAQNRSMMISDGRYEFNGALFCFTTVSIIA